MQDILSHLIVCKIIIIIFAGMLSLNITWRGRSYMGTLIDCSVTDHGSEWAAPW